MTNKRPTTESSNVSFSETEEKLDEVKEIVDEANKDFVDTKAVDKIKKKSDSVEAVNDVKTII